MDKPLPEKQKIIVEKQTTVDARPIQQPPVQPTVVAAAPPPPSSLPANVPKTPPIDKPQLSTKEIISEMTTTAKPVELVQPTVNRHVENVSKSKPPIEKINVSIDNTVVSNNNNSSKDRSVSYLSLLVIPIAHYHFRRHQRAPNRAK